MFDYPGLKIIHVSCAAASYLLFVTRGVWMMRKSDLLQQRWVRIVPHVIDTVLLASAIALTVILREYPLTHGWLTAKVSGLIVYIALGTAALKRGRTLRGRVAAWIAAQLVFMYIVAVAVTRNPMPWTGFTQ